MVRIRDNRQKPSMRHDVTMRMLRLHLVAGTATIVKVAPGKEAAP